MLILTLGALARPAAAGSIAPNNGSDCDCGQQTPPVCFCYASGTVTTDNASDTITMVQDNVAGAAGGQQTSGFSHTPGTTTWGYAFCDYMTGSEKTQGSGKVTITDTAFKSGFQGPWVHGTATWTP